ncbi:hypothetical protein BD769DRAFT_1694331 [Suillus cothurnatus]|nr:hypothetical protein BD769DRAFT_1694331 [Suillus cothurnatus]
MQFQNRFLPLAHAEAKVIICEPLRFYQNVSTSKELRDASNQAEVLQRDFDVKESMRLDGFKAKTTAEKNLRKSGEWEKMGDEQRRLVEKMVLDGKRAGLALPEKECEVLMKLKRELSQACLDFNVGMTSSVFRRYANREGSDASFYSHAAVWGPVPGYELPSGKHHYPLMAMVANLAKPTPERSALMRHDDVTTFFQ